MKKIIDMAGAMCALIVLFLMLGPLASAAERGSADEAVALVRKAVEYVQKHGKEKAYAEFNNSKGQFRDRDLYIIVFDMNGFGWAHPNARLVGKMTGDIKDTDGKRIFQEQRKLALEAGKGWVDYKWPDPLTQRIENKSTYLEKLGDIIVMCGIYK